MQRITQVGVLSMGKVMGGAGVLMGAIIGVLYGAIIAIVGAASIAGDSGGGEGPPLMALAAGICIGAPILYGVFGFIGGLIYGVVLNLVFKYLGGLELRIEGLPDRAIDSPQ